MTAHKYSGISGKSWVFAPLSSFPQPPLLDPLVGCWLQPLRSWTVLGESQGGLGFLLVCSRTIAFPNTADMPSQILEGLATILIGVASYWMVHDFPDEARFLTDDERVRVIKRLREDGQASAEHEKFNATHVKQAYSDWKTYAFAIVYMGCDGALYAFSLFTPTIISLLGYKSTVANLLSVPPYAAAAVLTITVGWVADRTGQRGLCNIATACIGIVGFCMLIGSKSAAVKYAGVYLGALGIYPCIANTIVWSSNNVEGVFKRGVVMGTVIGWGNLNGIVSSNIYRDPPNYYIGHGVVLAYLFLFLVCGSVVTMILLSSENKARKEGKRDHWIEGKTEDEIRLLGDKR